MPRYRSRQRGSRLARSAASRPGARASRARRPRARTAPWRRGLATAVAGAVAVIVIVRAVLSSCGGSGGEPARPSFGVAGHPTALAVAGGQVWVAAPASGALTVLDARTGRRDRRAAADGRRPGAARARRERRVGRRHLARAVIVVAAPDGARTSARSRSGADVADVALAAGAVWAISSAEGVVRALEPGGQPDRECRSARTRSTSPPTAAGSRSLPRATARSPASTRGAPRRPARPRRRRPVAVALAGDAAWVADAARGTVARVDLRTGAVGASTRVGAAARSPSPPTATSVRPVRRRPQGLARRRLGRRPGGGRRGPRAGRAGARRTTTCGWPTPDGDAVIRLER